MRTYTARGKELEDASIFKAPTIVRRVCHDCNHGWMSELEQIAKPILTPLLQGRERRLGLIAQRIVATWIFKTVLMLREGTINQDTRGNQDLSDHYRRLYTHGEPPPSTQIWAARLARTPGDSERPNPIFRLLSQTNVRVLGLTDRREYSGVFYGGGFICGDLVVLFTAHTLAVSIVLELPDFRSTRLVPLHPPFDANLDWASAPLFSFADWNLLCERISEALRQLK